MDTLVPIFVCVVLPVMIVLIIQGSKILKDNNRTRLLMRAIESGNSLDLSQLSDSLKKPERTPLDLLNLRLLRGCMFTLLGIVICVAGIILFNLRSESNFGTDDAYLILLLGGISLAIGGSYLIVYFVSRKQVSKEAEEE